MESKPADSTRRGPKNIGRRARNPRPENVWEPATKLGRLVKAGKITNICTIFESGYPIKEHQIVDTLVPNLTDKVMAILSVQKQTRAGQRTHMKAVVVVGNGAGLVGLGVGSGYNAGDAIRLGGNAAKRAIQPVRRGYWGTSLGNPHTVFAKAQGKCGSVTVKLIPAPRGTGLVASPAVKTFLQMAGIEDVYTQSFGNTCTRENTLKASMKAISNTLYVTPDLWDSPSSGYTNPLDEHSYWLATSKRVQK